MKIGFIGTGVMGQSIVHHLLKENHEVMLYTRTKEKAASLLAAGATWGDTPKEVARQTDVIFSMVGYPQDVETIYLADNGILSGCEKGQIIIDMTTSSPALAQKIAMHSQALGVESIDAPVSGGDIGAQNGTLSIMCGGKEETFHKVRPLLEVFGQNIVYQGEAGAGQHTKMANQIAIATNMIGVCEAIVYAEKAGLDPDTVLSSIQAGAAGSWSLSNLVPRMLQDDFEPGFFVKHFLKDMDIALTEAEMMQLPLPGLTLAREMYHSLVEKGYGEKGTQVLYRYYES